MSGPHTPHCITHILSAAIAAPADPSPPAAMSQAEEIAELIRLNEELRAEKESAVKRAAKRYKDMMHANRRAERAEQALKNEVLERQDDRMKASALFCSYKRTIKNLEVAITQAQRTVPRDEQIQALQAANAGLEAAFAQQKEATSQMQTALQGSVHEFEAKIEIQKAQTKKEAEHLCEKRLAVTKKQMSDHFSRKAEVAVSRIQKAHQCIKIENEGLKNKLHQTQQMVEWHKTQAQQQAAQRGSAQGSQMAAGIHASFPLLPQHSFAQVKETANKRRRLNSTGCAIAIRSGGTGNQADFYSDTGITTPDRQRNRANSMESSAPASIPRRKAPNACRDQEQSSRQSVTPTRQNTKPRQHQLSDPNASSLQSFHQSPSQAQASCLHAQSVIRRQQLFQNFCQQLNANRMNAGYPQVSLQEALPFFNKYEAPIVNQPLSILMSSQDGHRSTLQQSVPMGQQEGARAGLQSPFLPVAKPFGQQTSASFNVHPPISNWGVESMSVPQIQSLYKQRQQPPPQGNLQGDLQSSAIPSQDLNSLMPTLTASHKPDPSAMFANDAIQTQAGPQHMNGGAGDMELQGADMYSFSEDSDSMRDMNGPSYKGQVCNWESSMPKHEGETCGAGNGQSPFGGINSQTFGNNSSFDSFSTTASASMPLTGLAPKNGGSSNKWTHQQVQSNNLHQENQQYAIDPALLLNNEVQVPVDKLVNQHTPSATQSAPFQCLPSVAPSMPGLPQSQPAPIHPPTSLKLPAPPPSSRSTPVPSARSTTTPAGPPLIVCLHCHENWWNESCDVREPCLNCIGSHKTCQRPRCLNFAAGTCINARCPRVHEGDLRFRNVIVKPKTLKRVGKKDDRRLSPVDSASQ